MNAQTDEYAYALCKKMYFGVFICQGPVRVKRLCLIWLSAKAPHTGVILAGQRKWYLTSNKRRHMCVCAHDKYMIRACADGHGSICVRHGTGRLGPWDHEQRMVLKNVVV